MKKEILLCIALLACCNIKAQYFCTTEKTELQYVNYDEVGQSTSNETATVQNVTQKESKITAQYLTKIVTNKTKNNTSYTLYNWSYDGNQTICQEDLMYGPYIKSDSDPSKYNTQAHEAMMEELKFKGNNSFIIKNEAKGGENIEDRSYSLIANMLKNDIQISGAAYMGTENISTTAGKFECIKLSYLKRTKIVLKSETLRIIEWYAKGIGLVKAEVYNTKGELHSKKLLTKIRKQS